MIRMLLNCIDLRRSSTNLLMGKSLYQNYFIKVILTSSELHYSEVRTKVQSMLL